MSSSNPVDSQQLQQYYSAHHGWVHAWLKRRLGNTHDAADLAQDVFVRLLVKPRRFDSDHHARAYLHAMSRHVCIDFWRRRELERAWQEVLASRPEAWAPSEEHQAIILETLQQVYAMLARLPEKVARCFVLVQVQGMNYREAAQVLGVTERSVTSYMAKAMFQCLLLEAELDQSLV
ncbi:sigma-70 family RNA polymerase sigma factor [Pseudomonas baltica]|uniref:sigma-70 family RNA polymerase sigma factor n=1 Tax=Pseudomonas baltica TaxID=2762576 RepID=UPI0028A209ED|nr:sigma-70 family RNA polymerase sigma factor [Pseudomonas baltica]